MNEFMTEEEINRFVEYLLMKADSQILNTEGQPEPFRVPLPSSKQRCIEIVYYKGFWTRRKSKVKYEGAGYGNAQAVIRRLPQGINAQLAMYSPEEEIGSTTTSDRVYRSATAGIKLFPSERYVAERKQYYFSSDYAFRERLLNERNKEVRELTEKVRGDLSAVPLERYLEVYGDGIYSQIDGNFMHGVKFKDLGMAAITSDLHRYTLAAVVTERLNRESNQYYIRADAVEGTSWSKGELVIRIVKRPDQIQTPKLKEW